MQIRNHIVELRRETHRSFLTLPEAQLPFFTHPDDALRVFAFIYTTIKVRLVRCGAVQGGR